MSSTTICAIRWLICSVAMSFKVAHVPNYEGIRIHGGNKPTDTDGCPLVAYFQEDMKQAGVYTTTANAGTPDESPDAYKDMAVILENIKETVDVLEMVKPVYNFKAGGE